MRTNKDIGLLKKLLLKIITFFQVAALKQDSDLYYPLTKLHFKIFFGRDLVEAAYFDTNEFRAAQKRHVAMVITELIGPTDTKAKVPFLEKAIGSAFYKNLLLEVRL